MDKHDVLDELEISEGGQSGLCEECIYGKQTQRPYDEVVYPETILLERVHVDIHGPTRVLSIGGAIYLMIVTDGASSY